MKITARKITSFSLVFLLSLIFLNTNNISLAVKNTTVDVIIKGKHLNEIEKPVIRSDRTFVPVRYFAERLGFKVEWLSKENIVKLSNSKTTIMIPIGKKEISVDGKTSVLSDSSFISENRTYLPLRALSELLSQEVKWDQKNKIAIVGNYEADLNLENTFVYTNDKYNYTLNFPNSWKSEAVLETKNGELHVYDKLSFDKFKQQEIKDFGPVLKIRAENKPVFITAPHHNVLLDYTDGIFLETDFGEDFQYFPETVESYKKIYNEAKQSLGSFKKLSKGNIYINNDLGFTMKFPESWSGQFEINKVEDALRISSKRNEIINLGTLHKYTTEGWALLDDGEVLPVRYDVLGKTSDYVFVIMHPSDVAYNLNNPNSVKKYEQMSGDLINKNYVFTIHNK